MDLSIYLHLFVVKAYACPTCAGSMGNPQDYNLVFILGFFVLLCYIPLFILYKMAFKHRKIKRP